MDENFKITYQQLKDFLPNYPDWFGLIEDYNLTYEVAMMFNIAYNRRFPENMPLCLADTYTIVCMLSDAMNEWDI